MAKQSAEERGDKFANIFDYVAREVKKNLAGAAIQLVKDLGLNDGEWGIQCNPQLERLAAGGEDVPLWLKLWAIAVRHTSGYLPRAAGVTGTKTGPSSWDFTIDEGHYRVCAKHGATIAIHKVGKRYVPMTTGDLRRKINESIVAEYKAQGHELTKEQRDRVTVPSQEVRRAVQRWEELGFGFRGDEEGTPLPELRQTPEGQIKARKLSGEDKLHIYVYVRPRKTATLLTRHEDPALSVVGSVKPMYRQVVRLGLQIDPEAFNRDKELQELLRLDAEEREAIMRRKDEELRERLIEKGAVPVPPKVGSKVGRVCLPSASNQQKLQGQFSVPPTNGGSSQQALTPPKPNHSAPEQRSTPAVSNGGGVEQVTQQAKPAASIASDSGKDAGLPGRSVTPSAGRPVSSPRKPAAEVAVIDVAIRSVGFSADLAGIRSIFAACQAVAPDCTPVEVAHFVESAVRKNGKKQIHTIVGYLKTTLPQFMEQLPAWRQEQAADHREVERKQAAIATACSKCGGSGIVGADWQLIGEAVAAVKAGKKICSCPEGESTRELIDLHCPELIRSAS